MYHTGDKNLSPREDEFRNWFSRRVGKVPQKPSDEGGVYRRNDVLPNTTIFVVRALPPPLGFEKFGSEFCLRWCVVLRVTCSYGK